MKQKGVSNEGSIAGQVRQFFRDNPDEELNHGDLQTKFGCTARHAAWMVRKLKDEGLIEALHVIRAKKKAAQS